MRGHGAGRSGAGGALAAAVLTTAACSGGHAPAVAAHGSLPAVCGRRLAYPPPWPARPRYRIAVHVSRRGAVTGALAVAFTPDMRTGRIVFRLWPNGPLQASEGAHLAVSAVRVDGRPAPVRLTDPTTLVVGAGRRYPAGSTVRVALRFRLQVPGVVTDRLARIGAAVRLGSFFPILPWEPGVGWDLDPPTRILAEASSSPVADFSVRVRLPAGVQAVATGVPGRGGVWRAQAVRDFALAVARFRQATAVAAAPRPVRVVAAVAAGVPERAGAVAAEVALNLRRLSRRFGPYPYPELHVAVMPAQAQLGIEYPTMIFLGTGTEGVLTTHEVAHQWFYGLVGDDQARDPVLDEGLATYAMGIAFAGAPVVPGMLPRTGEPMRFWDRRPYRSYQLGVYVDGARAVRALGRRPLVDCALRVYVARNAYGIATQAGLVRALASVIPSAPARLRRYGIPFRGG